MLTLVVAPLAQGTTEVFSWLLMVHRATIYGRKGMAEAVMWVVPSSLMGTATWQSQGNAIQPRIFPAAAFTRLAAVSSLRVSRLLRHFDGLNAPVPPKQ